MDNEWKLERLESFHGRRGPLVLAIMDGVGIGKGGEGDAVALARTPTLDSLRESGLMCTLQAHGTAVGMPSDNDMGNSEVGHNALGAGQVYAQGARLVNEAIASGRIFDSDTWRWLVEPCVQQDRALHLVGLLSDGNVHSHIDHLFALIDAADRAGVRRLYVHPLLDGRDVPQTSAHLYIQQLEDHLARYDGRSGRRYRVASGGGRMKVTMDRYFADWSIVKRGWDAHVHGVGRAFSSAMEALETYRAEQPGILDQDLPEFVVVEQGRPVGRIEDGDAVVLFNFRGDRAIEITMAFEDPAFDRFDRGRVPEVRYAGMMQYDGDLKLPTRFLVAPPAISHTMGEYLARNQIQQYACSETQKFGHVTYFWNGNRSGMFDERYETYHEVPSDKVPFDQRPWMKAAEITDQVIERIRKGEDRFIRLNFANGDMVGHTGKLDAAVLAVAAVDLCLARLKEAVETAGGILVVTADHGNADEMFMIKKGVLERDATGRPKPKTSHTLNPVPFIIHDPAFDGEYGVASLPDRPGLGNVAATCLNLLGYRAPDRFLPSLIRVR